MGIHIIEGKDQEGPSAAALQKFLATQISRLKGAKIRHSFYIIVHKSHLVSFYPSPFSLPPPSFHSIQKFCSHFAEFITSFFHISTNLYHKSLWLHLQSARRVSNIMDTPLRRPRPRPVPLVCPLHPFRSESVIQKIVSNQLKHQTLICMTINRTSFLIQPPGYSPFPLLSPLAHCHRFHPFPATTTHSFVVVCS